MLSVSTASSPKRGTGLLRSSIYHDPLPVGIVAVGLVLGTYSLFEIPINFALLVAVFSGTSLVYLLDRMWGASPADRINHPERMAWVASHRNWLALEAAVLFASGCTSVFYLSWGSLIAAVVLGAVAGLHVLPDEAGVFQRGGIAKPLSIAGAWAVGGTILPLVGADHILGAGALLFALYRFLFILPNLLLADWADRWGDAQAGGRTWASGLSARRVRWVATGPLGVALCGAGLWAIASPRPTFVVVDAVGIVLMLGVVWGLNVDRPSHSFLADLVVGWPAVAALVTGMMV